MEKLRFTFLLALLLFSNIIQCSKNTEIAFENVPLVQIEQNKFSYTLIAENYLGKKSEYLNFDTMPLTVKLTVSNYKSGLGLISMHNKDGDIYSDSIVYNKQISREIRFVPDLFISDFTSFRGHIIFEVEKSN